MATASLAYEEQMSRSLLQEAHAIFLAQQNPSLFQPGLQLAEYEHRLGMGTEANELIRHLSVQMDEARYHLERDERRRDLCRLLVNIGRIDESIEVAKKLHHPGLKFQAFYELIIPVLAANQEVLLAVDCLTRFCLETLTPRADQPVRRSKIDRTMLIAAKLAELGERQQAEHIVLKAGQLVCQLYKEEKPLLEKMALLLLRSGLREEAIELLLHDVFDPQLVRPGNTAEMIKESLLKHYWPEFSRQLGLAKKDIPRL
jgi:hypothetical protein